METFIILLTAHSPHLWLTLFVLGTHSDAFQPPNGVSDSVQHPFVQAGFSQTHKLFGLQEQKPPLFIRCPGETSETFYFSKKREIRIKPCFCLF